MLEPIEVSCRGKVVFVNAAYLKLFGYQSASELLGRPTDQMVASASVPLVSSFQTARDAGESAPAVYRAQGIRKDGTIIDLEHRVSRYKRGARIYEIAVIRRLIGRRRPDTLQDLGESRRKRENGPENNPSDPSSTESYAGQGVHKLSPREMQVLQMVAQGRATKEIASVLGISVKTADSHRTHIMAKLGVRGTVNLLRYCLRAGLVKV